MTHTPLPWYVAPLGDEAADNDSQRIIRSRERVAPVACVHTTDFPQSVGQAGIDADFIVRACNAHDSLVSLAESVVRHFEGTDAPLGHFASIALALANRS